VATTILTALKLSQIPLQQVAIESGSSLPGSPVAGQLYFYTGTGGNQNTLQYYTGSAWVVLTAAGTGTVTSASVVTANGFAGTVATASSTPAITVTTTVTGVLKGNGTAISAATAGTDYLAPSGNGSALTGITVSQVSGAAPLASPTFTGTVGGITVSMISGAAPLASPTFTGTVGMSGATEVTVPTPVNPSDAATKSYVDASVQGLSIKDTVQAATTTTLPANTYANGTAGVGATLTGNSNGALASIDGVSALGAAVNQNITGVTFASTTITATVSSTTGLVAGQPITVAGITGFTTNNPNGTYVVNTVPSGTTFTYVAAAAPTGSYSSGGTVAAVAARILVKNEATAANDGIYVVTTVGTASTAYVLTRSTDTNTPAEMIGAFTFVEQGTTNGSSGWVNTNTGNITLGTTSVTFTQFSGAGELSAGTGITITGNSIALSTPVSAANGGTGQSSLQASINSLVGTGYNTSGYFLRSNGTNAVMSALTATDVPTNTGDAPGSLPSGVKIAAVYTSGGLTLGNGSSTTLTVTHNLNNSYPNVTVYNSTGEVICDVIVDSANAIQLGFATAPASDSIACVVVG
jgi:hypothetical protein